MSLGDNKSSNPIGHENHQGPTRSHLPQLSYQATIRSYTGPPMGGCNSLWPPGVESKQVCSDTNLRPVIPLELEGHKGQ